MEKSCQTDKDRRTERRVLIAIAVVTILFIVLGGDCSGCVLFTTGG